jgi:hypothetical protein
MDIKMTSTDRIVDESWLSRARSVPREYGLLP